METPIRPDMLERYKEEMRAYARKAGYTVAPPEEAPPVTEEPVPLPEPVETPPAELPAEEPGEQEPLFPVIPEEPAEEPGEGGDCSIWEEPAVPADAPEDGL